MALVGLGLIRPKFDVRQRQIEGRLIGRRQSSIERWRTMDIKQEVSESVHAKSISNTEIRMPSG